MGAKHIIYGSIKAMEKEKTAQTRFMRKQSGFTLIELIVVIVLTAILSGFTAMRYSSGINAKSEAENIAALVRFTQSLSMTHGGGYYFQISPNYNYSIKNSSGTAIRLPDTGLTTGTLPSGYAFSNLTNLPSQAIYFDGMGTPHTSAYSGNLTNQLMTTQASFQLTDTNGPVRTITISPVTGYVQVQ